MDSQSQRELLQNSHVIALVGHSDNPARTSYQIAKRLREFGYTVYPVNPTLHEIDGMPAYASLADVPQKIDIVNVFRRSEHLLSVVQEAIPLQPKAIWAQLGVEDDKAAQLAHQAGIPIVMNKCIKVAYQSLMG